MVFPLSWHQVDEIIRLTDSGIEVAKMDRIEPLDNAIKVDAYNCGSRDILTTDQNLTAETGQKFDCDVLPIAVNLDPQYAKIITGYDYCL